MHYLKKQGIVALEIDTEGYENILLNGVTF